MYAQFLLLNMTEVSKGEENDRALTLLEGTFTLKDIGIGNKLIPNI